MDDIILTTAQLKEMLDKKTLPEGQIKVDPPPHKPKRRFEYCYEANEYLAWDFKEPPAYCKGLLYPNGFTLIVGHPKSFKTFFALDLAFALATGKPFLGNGNPDSISFEIPKPVRVLYLQAELSDGRMQKRIAKMKASVSEIPPDRLFIRSVRDAQLNESGYGIHLLRQMISEVNPAVIIVDPLIEFFSGDENQAQEVSGLFKNLHPLLESRRCICFIHHFKKPNKDTGGSFNMIRGSSVFLGKVDSAIAISAFIKGQVALEFSLRNEETPDKCIASYDDNFKFTYLKPFGAPMVSDEEILGMMKESGSTTIKDLASKVALAKGCKEATIRKRISPLIKSGAILKQGETKDAHIRLP